MSRPPSLVLALNAGSSSLKLALFEQSGNAPREAAERRVARGAVERIGSDEARLWITGEDGASAVDRRIACSDHAAAVHAVLPEIAGRAERHAPDAVGHRIVHGGARLVAPARVDAALVATLRELVPFAPLHLPAEIACVEAVAARFPDVPQVACFDTAFHRRMPEVAQRFPLPRHLWDEGVRRYGFHGLSYEYVVAALGADVRGRAVLAHLGNGASMAAVRDGAPVETTMGMTPTGGFMMGTRSGDLDPGVLLHLLQHRGYDADRLDALVNRASGLLGVSGSSSDMQELLAREAHDPHAAAAVEMYAYHLRKAIGALAAALGGLDTLVFTGGIGEHAAAVRARACAGLAHLGVELDADANAAHAPVISSRASRATVRVVPTDEERMIARHTRSILGSA